MSNWRSKVNFPRLFSPITLRNMRVKNRMVMTAAHLGYCTGDGEVTERLIEFYVRRAVGGVGLIIVGGCPVDNYATLSNMIRIHDDRFIPGLKRLTESVKKSGDVRIAAQIYQAGRYVHSSRIGGETPFSSSAVYSKFTGEIPRALNLNEIPEIQDRFAYAAIRVKNAGFDAVEIHGGTGYIISQFLSPAVNVREDRYGGSMANRMQFGIEVIQKVREAVGNDFPIIMRLSGNEFIEGGCSVREMSLFAMELEKAGVDLFNITVGWHESRVPQVTSFVPRCCYVYAAQEIRAAVTVPVLACNRINDPALAEKIIADDSADMTAMTRALIADPDLPNKALAGRSEQVVHCVACNQGCYDNVFRHQPVTCMVNPAVGAEKDLKLTPASVARRVLVVGGGPAGLKAACVAAQRGHHVTLMEKSDRLGGQLLLNRNIPGRTELVTAAEDLIRNIQALNIKVVLDTEADKQFIMDEAPEVVVVATGAMPLGLNIPLDEHANVVQAWQVLGHQVNAGRKIVIVGGNAVGLETALKLANEGTIPLDVLHFLVANRAESLDSLHSLISRGTKEVTVVEMINKAGKDVGISTRWNLMQELNRLNVNIQTGVEAVAINENGLKVKSDKGVETIPADTVILAVGSRSENRLFQEIKDIVPKVYLIGDAREPRKALDAIKEGFFVGMEI